VGIAHESNPLGAKDSACSDSIPIDRQFDMDSIDRINYLLVKLLATIYRSNETSDRLWIGCLIRSSINHCLVRIEVVVIVRSLVRLLPRSFLVVYFSEVG
jgi:hypothetical protein